MSAGLALLQAATGVFFLTTGYRKVFRPEVRSVVVPFIMKQASVSAEVAIMVTWAEFLGGIALLTGIMSRPASLGLMVLMVVAYVTTILPAVYAKDKGEHWTKLLSNALCTPEAQLIIILVALFAEPGY